MKVWGFTVLTFRNDSEIPDATTRVFSCPKAWECAMEELEPTDQQEIETFETLLES